MVDLKDKPCANQQHLQAGDCDCHWCGYHVWDTRTQKDGAGNVVIDGRHCINGRPRA